MSLTFWIKRFLIVFSGVFVVLLAISVLRERALERLVGESALWAGISTAIFIATRVYRLRKGQHCELCGDTPELREGGAASSNKEERTP
jgi:hypothetical protein